MAKQILLSLDVPCDSDAANHVRARLADVPQIEGILGEVMVVSSELVDNAVTHSGGMSDELLALCLSRVDDNLTISVSDSGRSGTVARIPATPRLGTSGLGLRIVDSMSSRWGERRGDGYRVWAELPL